MFKLLSLYIIPTREGSLHLKFSKGMLLLLLIVSMALSTVPAAHAATTPSLGTAASYGILSSTYTNTTAGTVVNGDIGFTTPPAVTPGGSRTNYGSGGPYAAAGIDQGGALSALASQPCTFTFAPGAVNLSTDTTHGPVGVYTPGVYCSTGAMNVGGPLLLSGNGTYIFRPDGALTSTAGSVVTLSGTSACDVFWTPAAATTLGANTTFAGTVISNAGVTVGANVTWTGRSLAFGGTVTTDTDTISIPICASAPSSSSSISSSSITSSSAPASSSASSQTSSMSSVASSSALSSSVASSAASSSSRRRFFVPPVAQTSSAMGFLNVVDESPAPTPQVPLLPNTGVGQGTSNIPLDVIVTALFIALSFLFVYSQAKRLSSSGS